MMKVLEIVLMKKGISHDEEDIDQSTYTSRAPTMEKYLQDQLQNP